MSFWTFWDSHTFLAWCALWLVWGVIPILTMVLSLFIRTYRVIMVSLRGWPPAHLDADGDWKPTPKKDGDVYW